MKGSNIFVNIIWWYAEYFNFKLYKLFSASFFFENLISELWNYLYKILQCVKQFYYDGIELIKPLLYCMTAISQGFSTFESHPC